MAEDWTFETEPAAVAGTDSVTLVESSAFCLSTVAGDLRPPGALGLFFRDVRLLSRFELLVDGRAVEPLHAWSAEPYDGTFVGRATVGVAGTDRQPERIVVVRRRLVGDGMREDVSLRNDGRLPVSATVTVRAATDFADLFDVREGRVSPVDAPRVHIGPQRLGWDRGDGRGVRLHVDGDAPTVTADGFTFDVELAAHARWDVSITVIARIDDTELPSPYPPGQSVEATAPARRMAAWRARTPQVTTPHTGLARAVARTGSDLGALRVPDPERPGRAVVAAGVPWYLALFGRDSLLTSWMALPTGTELGHATLSVLARSQGVRVDPESAEEPGRIMHEMRHGSGSRGALSGERRYYGTADATPLFVMALGELRRWGLGLDAVRPLLEPVDRALDWIERYGDRDGDGFVEYERPAGVGGLFNQGWKDSADAVCFADGRLARPPIALAEVQAYTYAAYLARAELAAELGDTDTERHCRERAAALRAAFREAFWLPGEGYVALALDGDKRPVDAITSNAGHCLWAGILDTDQAAAVAARLGAADLFTGWGVRTLSCEMDRYDPLSYHNGSVWPHDSALVAAGLMRYGYVEAAQRIAVGLLDAADRFDGRLPELFGGFDRAEFGEPVPYPTSCSPQAWSAAAPYLLLRTLLRLEPDLPRGRVHLDPAIPERIGSVEVRNLLVGDARMTVTADSAGRCTVEGLPPTVQVARTGRVDAGTRRPNP